MSLHIQSIRLEKKEEKKRNYLDELEGMTIEHAYTEAQNKHQQDAHSYE